MIETIWTSDPFAVDIWWTLQILQDPRYLIPREFFYYSILRSCKVFSINPIRLYMAPSSISLSMFFFIGFSIICIMSRKSCIPPYVDSQNYGPLLVTAYRLFYGTEYLGVPTWAPNLGNVLYKPWTLNPAPLKP